MSDQGDVLELHPVRFRADGIGEWDQSRFAVFVPHNRIQSISLEYGFQCERPFLAALFGAAVFSVGLLGIPILFMWFFRGGVISKYYAALPIALLVGAWMLKTALSRGYFLGIDCGSEQRKVAFQKRSSRAEIEAFLIEVEEVLGIHVERISV